MGADKKITALTELAVEPAAGDMFEVIDINVADSDKNKRILWSTLEALFARVDGTNGLSADWDVGSHKITAEQLESDIATGTAPLIISSTTVVANLNADLLDGQEGTYYTNHASGSVGYIQFTGGGSAFSSSANLHFSDGTNLYVNAGVTTGYIKARDANGITLAAQSGSDGLFVNNDGHALPTGGAIQLGLTGTRWVSIWGTTITGTTLTDGTFSVTGGAISGATNTNWDAAYAHVSADGKSHADVVTNNAKVGYTDAAVLLNKLDDFATPDDNTDLNATTTYHGLLPKLDNNASNFLNGQGAWAAAGGGDVTKVGTPVDNQIGVWTGDGTIEGDAGFTWTGSALSANGAATFNNDNAAAGHFRVKGDTADNLFYIKADTERVGIGTDVPGYKLDVRGSACFNESGIDVDFRIEGENDVNLFFVDASADAVGIGTNTPDSGHLLHMFYDDSGTDAGLYIENDHGTGAASIRLRADTDDWNIMNKSDALYFVDTYAHFTDADIRLWIGNRAAHASGINVGGTPTAEWHVKQDDASGTTCVHKLEQIDQDFAFADYVGTVGSGNSIDTRTTSGATTNHIKTKINGTDAWVAFSTNAPS